MGHTIKTISYFIVTVVALISIIMLSTTLTIGTDTADRLQSSVRNELYLNSDASYAVLERMQETRYGIVSAVYYDRALVINQSNFEKAVARDLNQSGLSFKYLVNSETGLMTKTKLDEDDRLVMVKVSGTIKNRPYETNIYIDTVYSNLCVRPIDI